MDNNLIDLSHFENGLREKFHIYKLSDSAPAHADHYHDYYQVLYVCSGEVTHTHSNESLRLYHGDAFVIPPFFTHRLSFSSPDTDVFSLAFSMDLFHDGFAQPDIYGFLTELKKQNSVHLKISLNNEERSSVNSLMEILLPERSGSFCAASSLISSIMCILARGYRRGLSLHPEYSSLSDVIRCARYIDSHFEEDISIAMLSRSFNISSSDLCRKFPQYTGLTVNRYLNLKRINYAETLLRTGSLRSIQEVAEKAGYSDFSTFYRNFVRIIGVSPSAYSAGQH